MTSVSEARAIMLAPITPLSTEVVSLEAAAGRTLATAVISARAQPPFAASAMDGYALRAADTPGSLRIVGEAAAGHAFARALGAGEAVRISTGAPMPMGADAVLIQEDAWIEGGLLEVSAVALGRHVRAAGIDFAADVEVLGAGRRLDALALALAAATGAASLEVRRQPRVSVLCAGDEIVAPAGAPRADQIFESCSYAIAGLAREWGAAVRRCDLLPDDPVQIEAAAIEALVASDLVVFIGSASVGPHDHARPVFQKLGARLLVQKVDMRPGKPTWFATTPRAPVLGLPGNPASAVVAATLFLRPILERFEGLEGAIRLRSALLAAPLAANGAREAYLRARVETDDQGRVRIRAASEQDSSLLSVLADANALIVRSANAPAAASGEVTRYLGWT